MRHYKNCLRCSYLQKESGDSYYYYCHDKDCIVDPYDCPCNYDD